MDPTGDKALAEAVALLEATLDATHDGILVIDLQRQVVRYNRPFLKMFGVAPRQLEPAAINDTLAALSEQLENTDVLLRPNGKFWENPTAEIADTLRFKDGRVFERFVAPYRLGEQVVGVVATYHDVSQNARTEQSPEQHQAQKLEAIGRLAGGIAHDLNNALTAIAGYTELALDALADAHPARPDVQEIRRAAERAESVTRQLLAFCRKQMLEPPEFQLGDSLINLSRMLERVVGDDIELETSIAAEVPTIYGDPGQLEQAIINLAVNARDAMPNGGRLTLALTVSDIDLSFARAHKPMTPGRYVELAVTDTGIGMNEQTQAHVFEPFFTTKAVGKGTGLGLAMVYGTVKQCGGYIFLESQVDHGTTFRLYFPPTPGNRPALRGRRLPALARPAPGA